MAHGAGGKATQSMIEGLFVPAFASRAGQAMGDAGAVEVDGAELAMTTDSFVVKPIRFPGGSIGELAVNGTVNDLAVSGARPIALTLSLILEEGLSADDLRAEVEAIAEAARAAERRDRRRRHQGRRARRCDSMYICTTGVGRRDPRATLAPDALRPGDRILLSGTIGEHGTAIMLARGEFELDADDRVRHALAVAGRRRAARGGRPVAALHARRDARRRGLGAQRARARLARGDGRARGGRAGRARPSRARRRSSGIDPMYVANEGKLVAFVAPEAADAALAALRSVPGCERAAEIGEVRTEPPGMVLVETSFGGRRVMDQLVGDPLPRIC